MLNSSGAGALQRYLPPLLIVLAVVTFQFRTPLPNYYWGGGDVGLYLAHAHNLAEGHPYGQTLYIFNPHAAAESPRTYPPLYPLALAPLYRIYGLNIQIFKAINTGFFALTLIAFFLLVKRWLTDLQALLLLAAVGFLPFYWETKDMLLPDVLYTALSMLALLGFEEAYDRQWVKDRPIATGSLLALLLVLPYAARSAGAVLVAAVFIYEILRSRGISRFAVVLGLGFGVGLLALAAFGHTDGSYFLMWSVTPHHLLQNAWSYFKEATYIFSFSHTGVPALLLLVYTAAMALVGFAARIKAGPRIVEFYFLFYLLLLLEWSPGVGVRYLVPVVLLYLYYVFSCTNVIAGLSPRFGIATFTALVAVLTCNYVIRYHAALPRFASFDPNSNHHDTRYGLLQRNFLDLCTFIRKSTKPDDRFLAENPRLLALLSDRGSVKYSDSAPPEGEWPLYRQLGVSYLVVTKQNESDARFVLPLVKLSSAQKVYTNDDYDLYRIP